MNAGERYFSWRDEREGLWTRVQELPDRVEFWPGPSYRRGVVAENLVTVFVGGLLLCGITALVARGYPDLAGCVALVILGLWRQLRASRHLLTSPFFSIRDGVPTQQIPAERTTIWSSKIDSLVLRNNSGRSGDDSSLWQLYIWTVDEPQAKLLFQQHQNAQGWGACRELTEKMSRRWGVKILEPDRQAETSPDLSAPPHLPSESIHWSVLLAILAAFGLMCWLIANQLMNGWIFAGFLCCLIFLAVMAERT